MIDEKTEQVGVIETHRAMNRAYEAGLDLVEVSPTSDPPVCRVMDYGKYLYEQKRKLRISRKASQAHSTTLKEIRLRPETDPHDLGIKVAHARQFLEKGHKVQFTMFFRGRQMLHQDKGREIYEGIAKQLEDLAKIEKPSTMAHRRMTLIVVPNK